MGGSIEGGRFYKYEQADKRAHMGPRRWCECYVVVLGKAVEVKPNLPSARCFGEDNKTKLRGVVKDPPIHGNVVFTKDDSGNEVVDLDASDYCVGRVYWARELRRRKERASHGDRGRVVVILRKKNGRKIDIYER